MPRNSDFEIELKTFAAIQALAPKIETHQRRADSRRTHQIIFAAARRARAGVVADSGLLPGVLPELVATIACEQSPDFHPEGTVFEHIRLMLEKMPPDAPASLPWAVLLHDIAKPATAERDPATGKIHFYGHEKVGALLAERILTRLRFPKRQIAEIIACVRQHMQFKDVKQMRKATLRRLLLRETFPLELELHRLDCLGSHGDLEHYDFLVEQAAELKKKPAIRPPLAHGRGFAGAGSEARSGAGRVAGRSRAKSSCRTN